LNASLRKKGSVVGPLGAEKVTKTKTATMESVK